VVEDDSISPGGCRIITLEGEVDADIKTQLEEIERQLLG
jgi:flagellar biosynthesis/type III secretory pathway protein FliH